MSNEASGLFPDRLRAALVDRYEIEREIGRGGMATVWLARRLSDGTDVAVKVLKPELAHALAAQRFLREIHIAASVRSPSLVPLEQSGEVDGLPYYIMPFAAGGSLRQRIDRVRQLPLREAVSVAREVAAGLVVLHREGIVHRDIKPENVLLSADAHALLADYGIARAVTASATEEITSTGIVIGTPAYMSPEQAGGGEVDARSDQYAWGVVVYEMLAGVTPFHGASAQAVIARNMIELPPSLRVVRPAVPEALEAIVMRTLEKVPADRFASVEELLTALEGVGDLDTPAGRRLPMRPRIRRWIAGASAIAIVGLLAASGYAKWRPPLDPDRVVVFPFTDITRPGSRQGEQLALLVGSALERTDATRWLDGTSLLDDAERSRAGNLSLRRLRAVARQERAGYFLNGSVSRSRDSVRVQVQLYDVANGALVDRKTEAGIATASIASDLVLKAVVRVLPRLTGLEKIVDVSGLTGHNPSAVDDWLHGEREYRNSRMEPAFAFLARAATADSTLAPAALRAASAASVTNRPDSAYALVRLALRHARALSPRQARFGNALERFLAGRADEAIAALRPLLSPSEESADAWMLAGEIHLHLLPTVGLDSLTRRAIPRPTTWPLEQLALEYFENARKLDPDFSPPLAHLAEIAARRGDAVGVARFVTLRAAAGPDTVFEQRMALTLRCLNAGVNAVGWPAEVRRNARTVFRVGQVLRSATSVKALRCGVAAFSSILAADTATGAEDWSSLVNLQGMLVAQGQTDRALQLVDSAVAQGLTPALGLYVVDAAAGVNVSDRATPFVNQLYSAIETRTAPSLWLLTLWSFHTRDVARLEQIHARLVTRVRAPGQRLDSLMERVAAAYLATARHDTVQALRQFSALLPTSGDREIDSMLWESLAPERLTYARLLLSRGDAATAHLVASTFDQPSGGVHPLFLSQSLALRVDAARALHDNVLERKARNQLATLRAAAQ